MKNPLLAPELRELLAEKNGEVLSSFLRSANPALAAEMLSALSPSEIWEILNYTDARTRALIFGELDQDTQVELAQVLKRNELAQVLSDMSADERVDLLKRLGDEKREALLPGLAQAEREDIRRLAAYREGTAGSIMTSEYVTLSPELTAVEAIAKLRREAPDKETIYYCYVVDQDRKLIGFCSLKDLILADPNAQVGAIMHRDVMFAKVDDDQEEVARTIAKYDLLALPIVDSSGVIVGIVTYDDAMDVLAQENTEDVEKFMAIAGSHEAGVYLKTPVWKHFTNRVGWIVALAVLGFVSGAIVHNFEALLLQFAVLATFMPMLADTGGNVGSQSATLVVRALAVGEISVRDVSRVLLKEFAVSILMAAALACVALARLAAFGGISPGGPSFARMGCAVSLALGLQVISSTMLGAVLPLGAARLGFDPAVIASPALTTIVDILGLLIFFTTAKLVLGV